jgi:RimJ/RimL family protein N-acetyltransferase
MLWIGFHILGLNSVHLITMSDNVRAQKAYEKAGFKRAGVFRQGAYVNGAFHDFIIMDVLRDEFFEIYPPGTTVGESP